MKYVIVSSHFVHGLKVEGPYDDRAAATSAAFNKYGPANEFGAPVSWSIKTLEKIE